MARKRLIDPHFWESAQDRGWLAADCVVMMAAISASDDEGRGRISAIKHNIENIIDARTFKKSMLRLHESIILYRKIYFILPNFAEYNKISHPTKSKIPEPTASEIKSYPQNFPEFFGKTSKTVKFSLNKFSLNKFKVNGEDSEQTFNNELSTSQLFKTELPLLTNLNDYAPEDYGNEVQVTDSIRKLIISFLGIENPEKRTITSFVNVVMHTKQVKNKTAFEYLFNAFNEFPSYPEEKRNLAYLYKRVKGRINDALIEAREKKTNLDKQRESKESAAVDNEIIEQLTSKMKYP